MESVAELEPILANAPGHDVNTLGKTMDGTIGHEALAPGILASPDTQELIRILKASPSAMAVVRAIGSKWPHLVQVG
jgi:hypothetical protein